MTLDELFSKRLLIVTGKGGVGKTTVSLALAYLNAKHRRRSVVAFTDDYATHATDKKRRRHVKTTETKLDEGVYGLKIFPETVLEEYIRDRFSPVIPLYGKFFKLEIIKYFFDAAPGIKELLTLGKVWNLCNIKKSGKTVEYKYDQVIFDAPSMGHAIPLFEAPEKTLRMVKSGPFREHVVWVEEFLNNPSETLLVTVTTPEELALEEVEEIIEAAEKLGIPHGLTVMNLADEKFFDENDARMIAKLSESQTLNDNPALAAANKQIAVEEMTKSGIERLLAIERPLAEDMGVVLLLERIYKAYLDGEDLLELGNAMEEQLCE